MKGKSANVSTQFFNLRLFLEGLKRLRVIGLATAILTLTISALVPIVTWIEYRQELDRYMEFDEFASSSYSMSIDTEFLCVPAGIMVFLAPFFFFVLFSFLQKRKESDFFHAIPYTRTCVYVSFTAAAMAFVLAIQLACGLVAGLLWGMIPFLTIDLVSMVVYVLLCMLAAAMLSSFMMLALTVSGTGGSCMLLFLLFAGFTRIAAAIFLGSVETIDLIPSNDMWNNSFLSPLWFLPINVIYYWGEFETAVDLMYRPSNVLYSLAVTLAVFALAGLIYKHRRSEMAGNPAPGVRTQALFRILFTTLPAFLFPLFVLQGTDASVFLILVVGVLLVYFLYELITTKRPKNMLKAIPGLGIVAAACVVFSLGFVGYRTLVINEKIDTNEIKTVSMESGGFVRNTYQGRLLEKLRTDDPTIIATVADRLAYSQKYEGVYVDDYWNRTAVTIRLKNGRIIQRDIIMTDSHVQDIQERFMELDETHDLLFSLPESHEVNYGGLRIQNGKGFDDYHHMEFDDISTLYEIFCREFNALSEEQKREVMEPTLNNDYIRGDYDNEANMILTLNGNMNGIGAYFSSDYFITDALPETRACMVTVWSLAQRQSSYYRNAEDHLNDTVEGVLDRLAEDAEDSAFATTFPHLGGSIDFMGVGTATTDTVSSHTFILKAEDIPAFVELMSRCALTDHDTTAENFTVTEYTYLVNIQTNMEDKFTSMSLRLCGAFSFTPEDLELLSELLGVKLPKGQQTLE